MDGVGYTWDDEKAAANEKKHGIDFETATEVFLDPARYEEPDDRHSESEDRWVTVGMGGENILFVVFTERQGDIIRIISARRADKDERRKYYRFHS